MLTIAQIKQLKSGLVIDEVRGILTAVQEHKTVPTARGPATVQNFTLTDSATGDWIKGAIWDHADLSGLVGYEIILISVKGGNNRFGGVKCEDKVGQKKDPNDPNEVPPTYKNLSVGNSGVVHTPATYAAIPRPAAPAPAPAPVPAPAAAAAPPAETAAPAPKQAPVPVPTRAAPPPDNAAAQVASAVTPPVPAQASVPAPAGKPAAPVATFESMVTFYQRCLDVAARTMPANDSAHIDAAWLTIISSRAATLFIQGCDYGFHKATAGAPLPVPGKDVPF